LVGSSEEGGVAGVYVDRDGELQGGREIMGYSMGLMVMMVVCCIIVTIVFDVLACCLKVFCRV
jgi:hypothetical protein